MGRLFGTDGIRGVAGTELTAELATRVGRALVGVLCEGGNTRVLIGMDTRESSDELALAIAEGVSQVGAEAVIVGVCSTPAVAYLVKNRSYNAGVMISASHNPYQYNGIKIFGGDGYKLSDLLENKIEDILDAPFVAVDGGKIIRNESETEYYLSYLKQSFGVSLDGLRIGIDCANGSAYATARDLFCSLGAECHILAENPDGKNINNKCGSTHLESLRSLVTEKGLDLGIAFDGDADRCLAIDEFGNEIDGDFIMAIISLWLREEGRLFEDTVVGTVMSNLGFIKFCEENGLRFIATKVGDRYVLELMNEKGYSFGGEQSGHLIMGELATTGDGQLTAVALLSRIKKSGKSLSALASVMRKYPQYMVNIHADREDKSAFSADESILAMIKDTEDALRGNGRLVIRPSGTEPLIRIMAEGEELDYIRTLCDGLAKSVSDRLAFLKETVR